MRMLLLRTFLVVVLLSDSARSRGRKSRVPCASRDCQCRKVKGKARMTCVWVNRRLPVFHPRDVTYDRVNIANANLTRIPKAAFRNVSTTQLDLSGNLFGASGFNRGAFVGLEARLEVLLLPHCRLATVPTSSISRLRRLATLNLDGNVISVIPRNAFKRNRKLRELRLFQNQLRNIDAKAFRGLARMERLQLAQNRLPALWKGNFRGMRNLTTLDLSGNLLTRIVPGTFSGLNRLKWLDLASNLLTSLTKRMFKGLKQLQYVNLDGNPLTHIGDGAFAVIPRLKYLSLDLANVSRLSPGSFVRLARVKTLIVGDVNRPALPARLFRDLRRLKNLSVLNHRSVFKGLTPELFPAKFGFGRLSVWTAPLRPCNCDVAWIREFNRRGAYVHGYCDGKRPISCQKLTG
ncbi:hypothetical protein NP493_802g00002 [Ridgeia piscesae]|uniref:Uncharacterized protein n=1 Tax=Ridgeia piscesae TaxID=27915 RepID=A0AAD9KN47_RIDPI|nr:hypothetical protein NP493_802g00002 [Ridgeia piscesae]